MRYYVGLDVSHKRTSVCVIDDTGGLVWEGEVDTHPEMIVRALSRWSDDLCLVGLETGSMTPWLARTLKGLGLPVAVMDARRAADAVKARPAKTDRSDAWALAEMLRTGWFTEVYVKSEHSHRLKAILSARDQLVRNKRSFSGGFGVCCGPLGSSSARARGRRSSTRRRGWPVVTTMCCTPA